MRSLERALELDDQDADAWFNLAGGLSNLGRYDESLAAYGRALTLRPGYPGADWNKCLLLLRAGRPEGWDLFESRWNSPGLADAPSISDRPTWDGRSDLAGKTLLLHYEQGFGDSLQMMRYIPLLAERGAEVILAIQPAQRGISSGWMARITSAPRSASKGM